MKNETAKMKVTLNQLQSLLCLSRRDLPDRLVAAVTEDSRRVGPGAVFVATQGEHVDGHDFIDQAVAQGAVAVIGARSGISEHHGVPYFSVSHPRRALGLIAHRLAGDPTASMTVIGITGTNGKSSSAVMTGRVLEECGIQAGSFGTLGYAFAGEVLLARHTTPFGEDLADIFQRARAAGVTHVAMEVSSHALEQERVAGIHFRVAAFTNLTQDHLDFHESIERYRRAKVRLFERVEGHGAFTVVNQEDPHARWFVEASNVPCFTFGGKGDCRAESLRVGSDATVFTATTPWGVQEVKLHLLGRHNVANALCVVAICGGLGLPLDAIAGGIEAVENVPGRFERVHAGQPFEVVVDYAHTEDGLRNVLEAARSLCKGRIICVFGCGGDRDKGKRPKMGAAAAELADFAIITSDNPRTEPPERILLDIEVGAQRAGKRKGEDYIVVLDRAEAIRQGIEMAKPGDLVLIAGKGHEDYQIVGTERIHFDDREVARSILEDR
jgi:UDP-N-acetylmuramoyl-L-alanyl-D-glutamate--2,6-diaminopimelate ligase